MSKEWLTCAPTRTQTIRLTTHVAKTIANIVAGTVVLNKVVLRAAHAFEYHWWTWVKRKRKIIKEWRKGERWKRRKKGEMFQRFCRLWGKCFSKGGFIALHVITKFLLVLLLIDCSILCDVFCDQQLSPGWHRPILVLNFVLCWPFISFQLNINNTDINSSIHSLNRAEEKRPSLPPPSS